MDRNLTRENVKDVLLDLFPNGTPPNDPSIGFATMFDFYRNYRAAEALPITEDGDMLIFQFGTYDWGQGMMFNLVLTRQLIFPDVDQPILWQLNLSYLYDPEPQLDALSGTGDWINDPNNLDHQLEDVMNSEAVSAGLSRRPIKVDVDWVEV